MTGVTRVMAVAAMVMVLGSAVRAGAQAPEPIGDRPQGPGRAQKPPNNPPGGQISPMDVQAMFEALTLMEAERFVMLTPEQYPVFVQRLKRLQEARRVQIRGHNRALGELRQLANPQTGRGDDATIDSKLKELDSIDTESRAAIAKAMEGIDQLLSPRQRARFRLLEDNMEKKKIDFLTKVRQPGGRGGER